MTKLLKQLFLDSGKDPATLETELTEMFQTNVIGNVHVLNLFMPLILKGNVKKVVALSTGLADLEITRAHNLHENAPYAISKAALNMAMGKFSAEYAKDGVLFISICPGVVETGNLSDSKLTWMWLILMLKLTG